MIAIQSQLPYSKRGAGAATALTPRGPSVSNQDHEVCCSNGAPDSARQCSGATGPYCERQPALPGTPLTKLLRGQCGVLSETDLEPGEAGMLRAMGLRPRVRLKLCQLGEPCIVEVCCGPGVGSRIALHRALAERVRVTPMTPDGAPA